MAKRRKPAIEQAEETTETLSEYTSEPIDNTAHKELLKSLVCQTQVQPIVPRTIEAAFRRFRRSKAPRRGKTSVKIPQEIDKSTAEVIRLMVSKTKDGGDISEIMTLANEFVEQIFS